MAVVTMREMLEAGVHFGHQTRRWNPKMKRFILTERNGLYIIDLHQTLSYVDRAYEFVKETVAHGGTVLFVGTKRQAQGSIAEQATRVNMPYVNQRWLGGMLTNFSTVYKRLQRLKELESMEQNNWEGTVEVQVCEHQDAELAAQPPSLHRAGTVPLDQAGYTFSSVALTETQTRLVPRMTFETVVMETEARLATSTIVDMISTPVR